METIGRSALWSFVDDNSDIQKVSNTQVRGSSGHHVSDYLELATRIAELQYRNPDYVLLFRGQPSDYKNKKLNSSLKPSLFRPEEKSNKLPSTHMLRQRFTLLNAAERMLLQHYSETDFPQINRLKRYRILRWSLLQHYEICQTPLLDVTHSLRIAASFASFNAKDNAYVFVLGVPNLSGSVTASAESGLQIIRLASVCPPQSLRPHIQEGYLLGEYPDMGEYYQKELYPHHEIDFGLRLIAKFKIDPSDFWQERAFKKVPKKALYPNKEDPMYDLAHKMKSRIEKIDPNLIATRVVS